ncbi:phosphatidate cytidylyltransferase, mitochondrial-like isoform X2 [Camellia sinensis]|uniref:phosphatidate cytidylyltransferase, mitochondrial-like isoform X2 n=1 Tax=Camellia sinensis TaxID=4442 RepID=UPI001036EC70|nr:phosphatidate cytidylyltransferase, mitochondrial-like isoform X2 [Camellia sinensis]
METEKKAELVSLLRVLPPVEFCCVNGSALHPSNSDKSSMGDYILGVSNPLQWHTEVSVELQPLPFPFLYFSVLFFFSVADEIGVGVHFNPFVTWKDKMFKYGVVRMDDLVRDVLKWERFYLSGRLQKPILCFYFQISLSLQSKR